VQILNLTRNNIISGEAKAARSFFSRLRGLMFSKPADLVLVSPKENIEHSSIHMLFMRYPIDVLWLDSGMKVVDVARRVPPFQLFKPGTWRVYKPAKDAKYVVEIAVKKLPSVAVGDVIEFKPPYNITMAPPTEPGDMAAPKTKSIYMRKHHTLLTYIKKIRTKN
jgi:uncharacterized membrane protein (UPF0127 family)